MFDHVRKERPNDLGKILPIEGDITQPSLAISAKDREMLYDTVNLVFHSAATVKFDEKLKLSVTINMLGTQRLVELCKRMTHLKALVNYVLNLKKLFLLKFLCFRCMFPQRIATVTVKTLTKSSTHHQLIPKRSPHSWMSWMNP